MRFMNMAAICLAALFSFSLAVASDLSEGAGVNPSGHQHGCASPVLQVDFLDRKITLFRLKNASVGVACRALGLLGVPTCYESPPQRLTNRYVDTTGVTVFPPGVLIRSIELENATVSECLDRIVQQTDGVYQWSRIPGSNTICFLPVESSLRSRIGKMKIEGKPMELLLRNANTPGFVNLPPTLFRGHNHLPSVSFNFPGGSASDLLNMIAAQHSGLVWIWSPKYSTSFGRYQHGRGPDVDAVNLDYGVVQKTDKTRSSSPSLGHYKMIQEPGESGQVTLIARKAPSGW